mmetsp:Transcript_11373/g.21279  ORF Transcript_11373/g.21279 Transcript_11373/m.21279 type:complete len:1157 (-) Transcript_11373:82-3552(-)
MVNLGRSQFPKDQVFSNSKNIKDGDGYHDTVDDSEDEQDYDDDVGDDVGGGGGMKEDNNTKSTKKMENCMVFALICAKNSLSAMHNGQSNGTDIPLLGDSDDDDDDDEEEEEEEEEYNKSGDDSLSSSKEVEDDGDDSASMDDPETDCNGEVVIVLASRRNITIQKRILLKDAPNFIPTVAIHPHTHVNKILVAGIHGDMILLNIRTGKMIHKFTCLEHEDCSEVSALEQSPAVDTVAVGTVSGMVHLVNIRMDVKLFTLAHGVMRKSLSHRDESKITSLSFRTDALALEHNVAPLAVGQMNGTISVWDLTPRSNDDSDDEFSNAPKSKRTLLCQMECVHKGGVAKLTYLPQEPLLLSSGVKSNCLIMNIFDNPNHTGRVLRQRVGHTAPPGLIRYQHSSNGSVLASMADGTDAVSCQILSCGGKGDNSLRVLSTARSVLDREFGQGKGLEKKARELGLEGGKADLLLKPIIAMASCETRSRDWGDLVTIHEDHAMAYVWSTKRKAQIGPVLRQEEWNISAMKSQPPKSAHATSVAISSCGNFAMVGTKGGVIYKYNIESGLPRGAYPRDAIDVKSKMKAHSNIAGNINRTTKMLERTLKVHKLHKEEDKDPSVLELESKRKSRLQLARHVNAAVVGLAVDMLNRTLISVGSDAKLILWSFATHAPHKKSPITLIAPATKLVHARDSDLLAISLENYSILLFDCTSLSVVRKFGLEGSGTAHSGPISDLAFSPDARNLYSASFDSTIRVWDVPTNTCVDWLAFTTPPTSLTLSTTGEFLATAHQDRLGISLWCDRSFFQTVHINGGQPPSVPFYMDEPASAAEEVDGNALTERVLNDKTIAILSSDKTSETLEEDGERGKVLIPKSDGIITLSGLPAAHWRNLFHLELVKERNKPTEAPKKPPSAPFFLQWRGGETAAMQDSKNFNNNSKTVEEEKKTIHDGEWEAAWDDDDDENQVPDKSLDNDDKGPGHEGKRKLIDGTTFNPSTKDETAKKRKVSHFRSKLASVLLRCSSINQYEAVTEYLSTMGPSAIDVAFSSLCHGMHDLEEGLDLLHLCSLWLLEACRSRRNYEAINAYMHRFLHIHATTIAGIDVAYANDKKNLPPDAMDNIHEEHLTRKKVLDTIVQLKNSHKSASDSLRNKMQETLCLLRHFSRMV